MPTYPLTIRSTKNKGWGILVPHQDGESKCWLVLWHWNALYMLNNHVTYFDSFGVEYFQNRLEHLLAIKTLRNIFRIQGYDSIMCGYYCIGFINFILERNTLRNFTNIFSTNDF